MSNYRYEDRHGEEGRYVPPRLEENRSFGKYLILSLVTCSIYSVFFFTSFGMDLDKVAKRRDGSKTISYIVAFIISLLTFNIALLFWHYEVNKQVEEALGERDIACDFSTTDFWVWQVVGSLFLVGPFVYHYRLIRAMNLLCKDYNEKAAAEAEAARRA